VLQRLFAGLTAGRVRVGPDASRDWTREPRTARITRRRRLPPPERLLDLPDPVDVGPQPIPWRRVARLLRPLWRGTAAMVGLSVAGVLVGLVPPLVLGVLVNALVERNDKREAALLAALVAAAIVAEAVLYIASDSLYARNASRLYRNLRVPMFAGALSRARRGEDTSGLPSRFISDAETLERATLSILDTGAMLLVEFVSALIALGTLEPWTLPVVAPVLAGTWVVTRRMQKPAADAGQRRQEALETMTRSIVGELDRCDDSEAISRFRVSADRVMGAEVRFGWLQALNLQGSGGLAKLGPIAVVVAAAFAGTHHAGTLISIYLLAQRTFWGFDGIVDLSLATQSVRGAVARCFELVETATASTSPPATA
jgi:ABC-type bacteriocin/lantibiotic exporter with double-glycine peptidase domain